MNIKQTLSEVSQYFVDKLISGDFEFLSCENHTAKVRIDQAFVFEFWIANQPPETFNFYLSDFSMKGGESLIKFNSEEDKIKVWEKIKPLVQKYKTEELKKQKEEELRQLEEDLSKFK